MGVAVHALERVALPQSLPTRQLPQPRSVGIDNPNIGPNRPVRVEEIPGEGDFGAVRRPRRQQIAVRSVRSVRHHPDVRAVSVHHIDQIQARATVDKSMECDSACTGTKLGLDAMRGPLYTGTTPDPSASMRWMPGPVVNTICEPSGDQNGERPDLPVNVTADVAISNR